MKRFAFVVALVFVIALPVFAAKNDAASLKKEAKISEATARATALAKVPGGTVEAGELEREHGKLVYSFDIKSKEPGVTEVQVSAIDGKIVSVKHETPKQESAEKKKEAKEAAAKKH
jgi:hypothetical protein